MYIEYQVEANAKINIIHKTNEKLNTKRIRLNIIYNISNDTRPTKIQNSTSLI